MVDHFSAVRDRRPRSEKLPLGHMGLKQTIVKRFLNIVRSEELTESVLLTVAEVQLTFGSNLEVVRLKPELLDLFCRVYIL